MDNKILEKIKTTLREGTVKPSSDFTQKVMINIVRYITTAFYSGIPE